MTANTVDRVSNWASVSAAVIYLSTFLAVAYGLVVVIAGGSFVDATLFALPRVVIGCVLLLSVSAAVEAVSSAIKRARRASNRVEVASYVPH